VTSPDFFLNLRIHVLVEAFGSEGKPSEDDLSSQDHFLGGGPPEVLNLDPETRKWTKPSSACRSVGSIIGGRRPLGSRSPWRRCVHEPCKYTNTSGDSILRMSGEKENSRARFLSVIMTL